jgi:CBS domain containing-hemolysin-like protein
VVEEDEEDMLHAVFDFGELLVRQVMVPRTEMVAVPAEASLDEIIGLALRQPYTRFPVYDGDLDHILGVVHLRDLMRARHAERPGSTTARGVMREAIFVPETIGVNTLLRRFRNRRQHMAIVLDEYGGTAGMVTLEDVLEEIVGEVSDEFSPGPSLQRLPDGTSLVDGLTLIEEVNEAMGVRLEDPDYDTIAGFVLGRLGRLAEVGDTITADGVRIRVEALDGKRIARLTLFPDPPASGDAP